MKLPKGAGAITRTSNVTTVRFGWFAIQFNKSRKKADLPARRWDTPRGCVVLGRHGEVACHQESAWGERVPSQGRSEPRGQQHTPGLQSNPTIHCLFFDFALNFSQSERPIRSLAAAPPGPQKGLSKGQNTQGGIPQMTNRWLYDEPSVTPGIWLLLT